MNLDFERKLTIPMLTKRQYPLTPELERTVRQRKAELRALIERKTDRLLLIVGPCSADSERSVMDYVLRLRALQERVKDRLFLVPRIFTNKPRSAGEGYMGLLHQPDVEEQPDLFHGIIAVRQLHLRVVRETGFVCADELLYPENHRYLDDLLGYVTVGARSVEDQQHRLTASGLEIPVGMKNPLSGDLESMLHAISSAQQPHSFIYRGWAVRSQGNPLAHAVLRGGSAPNYRYEALSELVRRYAEAKLRCPAVIVDANHANSGKDPFRQGDVVRDVLASCRRDAQVNELVRGFMLESYLEDGAQPVGGGVYGRSITDPCLGWAKTERLLLELADKL